MATKTKPRQPVSRDERRSDLVGAARDLFAAKGYHATTVDDITRAAGVAKGTFYLYFGEKREIYHEVIRGFMQLVKDIGQSVGASAGQGAGDPLAFLATAERAACELMDLFLANRELARLAYRESLGVDETLGSMIRDFYRDVAALEADNVRVAVQLGLMRDVDPVLVAYAHIGMVERVLLAIADDPAAFPDPRRVVREMIRLAYEGVKVPGAPSPFGDD